MEILQPIKLDVTSHSMHSSYYSVFNALLNLCLWEVRRPAGDQTFDRVKLRPFCTETEILLASLKGLNNELFSCVH